MVKGAKEVYVLDIDNYTTADFISLKAAIKDNKIINIKQQNIIIPAIVLNVTTTLIQIVASIIGPTAYTPGSGIVQKTNPTIGLILYLLLDDGTYDKVEDALILMNSGEGTKFLADDGTYKEVSGGSEPYIISGTTSANDLYSYLSESTEINKIFNPNIIIDYLDGGGLYYSGKCIELTKDNNIFYLICTGVGSNPGGWGTVPFVLICTSESITVENYVRFINNTEYSLTLEQRGALNNLPYSRIPYVLGTHTIKEEWDYLDYYYRGSPYIPFNNVFVKINDGSTTYYGYAHSIYYDNDGYVIQCIGSVGIFGGMLSNQMFTFVLTEENGYELVDETDESIPKKIENLENAVYNGPVIIEYPANTTEAVTLTDEQINAAKNQNIKIKAITSDMTYVYNPATYIITDTVIAFLVLVGVDENSGNCMATVYNIDIANKTITKQ